ncbi:MAG: glutaminyl-peptide cyclotransferase [Bacteroidales bacterium]|nr:glutaminyl-peptide cyclotransferase [Bacteroidales bacterium]
MLAKRLIIAAFALATLISCQGKVKNYRLNVVREYPHDTSSYTQGLFWHDGQLYESTGQLGESTMRIVDLETGKALRRLNFEAKYFAEGSVILDGELFILTWTNKVAFIYDAATLEYKQTYSYPREGWGLTTDGKSLIASDGSSNLYFMDNRFQVEKTVKVTLDGRPVRLLNELEWIDGKIWANVYTTDSIMIINPKSGEVEATINCSGLLDRSLRTPRTDVLNGIAYNPADGKIYLTGKYWPKMFEIELKETK